MGMIKYIKGEMQIIKDRDPAIKTPLEVFLYPSFKAIIRYRIAHWLYLRKHFFLARWYSQRTVRKTGIEIHPGATIGKGLFIDHGHGVVIGETAIVGDNVTLYQGVTLGGTGKEKGKRHPTIGNNVMISAGAKILGSFTVGENSKIGAGSVVLQEVPPNSTVVGVPGRVVKRNDVKVPREEMDHIHFPDPVLKELNTLRNENICLRKEVKLLFERLEAIEKGKDNHNEKDKIQ
ncbi:MAG TPA: serine O-acetyltransferase EpsC [Mobilitalea sp.]|nr:serine O-acetyltransferase EpsC [Mobilitalea sp.]